MRTCKGNECDRFVFFKRKRKPSEIWANQSSQHNRQRIRFIKQGKASRLANFNGKYLKENFIKKNKSYCNSIHPLGCDTNILTDREWSSIANGNTFEPIKLINNILCCPGIISKPERS